ncbi:F-box only protein 24 isoform X2 [Eleutherodactylus coqui]|uniref:F-box only protein 24 isoform X2 n=1 Tax=Eleutherodactylus coqui TaxID=57060 RepID=UPI003462C56C
MKRRADRRQDNEAKSVDGAPADSHLPVKRRCLDRPLTCGIALQDLPPELVECVLRYLAVRDVVSLGGTCRYLRDVCNSPRTWRSLCRRIRPDVREAADWRRLTILNHTKGMSFHHFAGRWRTSSNIMPPAAPNGFQRFLVTADNLCILDYWGALFHISGNIRAPSFIFRNGEWETYLNCAALRPDVKDFTVDPRSDASCRRYFYVLASREVRDAKLQVRECDCVEIYHQSTAKRIFKMTFHPSMKMKKMVLLGMEADRQLLLLSELGKVYSVTINELSFNRPRSYITHLRLRKISEILPDASVTQMCSHHSSVLYVTGDGAVHLEAHSAAIYQDIFGTLEGFNPLNTQTPVPISIANKVVLCSLGRNHLALVDEFGRIFMQGNNRFGQLGTGDKIDRGDPCQIPYLRNPTDIFCGLNHTLVLVPSRDSVMEIHGCGCGARGRLPGWPKGSPSFVKLLLKVPVFARRISSTRDCLYIMSSYDPEEDNRYRAIPTIASDDAGIGKAAQTCEEFLHQLLRYTSIQERVAKTRDFITHLPLQGYQKDCLWQALGMVQRAAETNRTDGHQHHCKK